MPITAETLLKSLTGKITEQWPKGERFVQALAHGSMSVELYAPVDIDPQTPHDKDELYFVLSGSGEFVMCERRVQFVPGTVLFVPAGAEHRFENFTFDFSTWVVFWGPVGGENAA